MNKNNRIVAAVGSIIALLVSIPLDWFQISGYTANGMSGSLTFLVQLPIWLVAVLGVVGVSLNILNHLGLASIPRFIAVGFLVVSSLYVLIALVILPTSSDVKLLIGPVVALAGLILGYWSALSRAKISEPEPTP